MQTVCMKCQVLFSGKNLKNINLSSAGLARREIKINLFQVSLRLKDQEIAKSLLKVYAEIQILKVKKSCLLHKELLEEATYDVEKDDLPDMCDAPHKFMSKILLNRGVTKQNIAWRRFSCS